MLLMLHIWQHYNYHENLVLAKKNSLLDLEYGCEIFTTSSLTNQASFGYLQVCHLKLTLYA